MALRMVPEGFPECRRDPGSAADARVFDALQNIGRSG